MACTKTTIVEKISEKNNLSPEEFSLIIKRKSRIIMKDAKAVLEKAEKIIEKVPNATVNLETR